MKKIKTKRLYGGGGEIGSPSEDISKHKNYYVNNLTLLSEDEKKALIKASETSGISAEIIWTNMLAEGMDVYLQDAKRGYYNKTDDGYIDGFQYFGFDTLGDSLPNNKYLPKDISYTTERKLAEEELKRYQNSPHLTQAEKDRFNDPTIFMTSNEKGETVNYASPKSLKDAFYMMGAELRTRKDVVESYASKNNIELSPKSKDFFTYVSYNSGEGNMQKMLTSYNTKGYLKDDNYLETKPDKYWEDSYNYAQKRIKNQADVESVQYLSTKSITTEPLLAKEENPVLDKINTTPLNKSFDNLNTTINTSTLKKINKYKLGGTLTGGEGNDSNVKNTASLYQRLLDKKIIDPNITELQFSQLPKEQIDSYFKEYGKAIGAKTQAEVDAMPGTKQYLTPTIFTGKEATTVGTTSFDAEFAKARKSGLKEFNYNGGVYSTEMSPVSNAVQMGNAKPINNSGAASQISTDYMANIVQKEYGGEIGSSIGSALGTALKFIPGIGPIASTLATPLLSSLGGAAGSALDNKAPTQIPVAKEVAKTINPTGNYKFGGNISQYADGGAVNPKDIYSYLLSKGVGKEHALGMLANIQHESSFNPASYTIDSNDLPSGGLFQHNGSRYEAMVKHAGNDWKTNWQDQIDYALSEADTKKYLANKFSSPEEASMWFTKNWERPANADAKAKERVAALSEFDFAHQDEFDFAHQGNPRDMFIKAVTTPTVGAGMVGAAGTGIAMNKDAMNSMIIQRPNLINYQQKINSTGMGIRKYGGQVASNVVATSGGKFEDLGSNIILAKGKLHSEGGIKLDTNNQGGFDGMADIEVEDGEPIITDAGDTGYVTNRDVAKPYVKLLKQLADRQDKVSDNTRNLMKQEMIKKNEVLKESKGIEYKNGGALPSYYQGGLALSGLSDAVRNYNGAPYAGSFYNPFGGDNSVGATFGMVDPQTTSTINSTPTTPNTASLKSSSSGISASGDTGSVFSMDNSSDNLKTPTGDALQLAGMAIPTLYNLGRGLFDKAETVNPSYNPYEGEALSTLKSRSYNPQAIQNQLDRTFAAGRADINNLTSSAGTRLGNIQNLYSNLGQQRAAADLQGQQMNNQYKADTASALDNFGRQRLAAEGAANEYNWSNQVAKDNYISEGISNLGQTLTAFGQQKNTAAMNAVGLKILNEAFPNYYFDANTINQITSGVKPSWMKDDEFEKAKVLIYRAGFKG